jgi:hypothetical protein
VPGQATAPAGDQVDVSRALEFRSFLRRKRLFSPPIGKGWRLG